MTSNTLRALSAASLMSLAPGQAALAHGEVTHDEVMNDDLMHEVAVQSGTMRPREAREPIAADSAVQTLQVERLRIPDAPVIDSDYRTDGFVSRYRGQGQLLVSFTYTDCETLCPISNAILQQVDRLLADAAPPPLHIVTLSIDPEKDTPTALRENRRLLGASDNWSWLTALPADNRLLLESFGVEPTLLEEHDPMFLLGDVASGEFTRVIGMPDPESIIRMARSRAP